MNRTTSIRGGIVTLLAAGALAACGAVQSQDTQVGTGGDVRAEPAGDAEFYGQIPAGTQFEVQLQEAIGTSSNQAGDRWTGVVANDVTRGGDVLLERGSTVTGTVTKAGKVDMEGEERTILALEPRELEVGATSYPIEAEVVSAVGKESKDLVTGENAAIVGGGTLAGTLLGELLLDDALLGAVLGAAGGTAVAVARADTEIDLPQGTILTLELERAVEPDRAMTSTRRN